MRRIIAAVAAVLFAAAVSEAQQGTADLKGRVIDAQQGAMPGVTVTVRNQDSGSVP